jgi:hypothetical protein
MCILSSVSINIEDKPPQLCVPDVEPIEHGKVLEEVDVQVPPELFE